MGAELSPFLWPGEALKSQCSHPPESSRLPFWGLKGDLLRVQPVRMHLKDRLSPALEVSVERDLESGQVTCAVPLMVVTLTQM